MFIYNPNFLPKGFYVYAYLRSDGRPYYIGKGSGNRAIQPHKKIGVPIDYSNISIIAENLLEIGSFILERRLIRWYGRKDLGTGILRNRTDGGEGASGAKWTEKQKSQIRGRTVSAETKKKLSIINTGKKASNETKEKLSALRLGKKREFTDEWKANIKKANQGKNKGRVLSEETKAKIRESNRLTWLKKHPKDAR
jgi:hypothetical protein